MVIGWPSTGLAMTRIRNAYMDIRKIVIEKVETTEDRKNLQYLHKTIWGVADISVIPAHLIIAAQKTNGLALCAYYEGKPVGFSFGFLGLTDDRKICYWDYLIGVLEDYRELGIGYQIKMRQREIMLARGIDLAMWTFEPLESLAANLNFNKLGCIGRKYVRDYYGTMTGVINRGIPSDRLVVEWPLKQIPAVQSNRNRLAESRVLNETIVDESGVLKPEKANPEMIRLLLMEKTEHVYIEIPENYQDIRETDMLTVLEWRFTVRSLMETCFQMGAYIDGFIFGNGKSYYTLKKEQRNGNSKIT